ncbi:hypothetical protein [Ignavibacterium sp.]|uniref:hypothetical protein n=1 Tax=Ignavibacterium sp. TaxID=2651167 RepID=UPI0032971955
MDKQIGSFVITSNCAGIYAGENKSQKILRALAQSIKVLGLKSILLESTFVHALKSVAIELLTFIYEDIHFHSSIHSFTFVFCIVAFKDFSPDRSGSK